MSGRILVVEDDSLLREAVDMILTQAGYLVSAVSNGEDGLTLIRRFAPDLILLDVRLPGMSGVDILRRLRRQGHMMPVLMLTADHSPGTVRDVMADGGNGYMLKPFEPHQLVQRVRRALAPSTGWRELVLDA